VKRGEGEEGEHKRWVETGCHVLGPPNDVNAHAALASRDATLPTAQGTPRAYALLTRYERRGRSRCVAHCR
jgi:hypothetical protein